MIPHLFVRLLSLVSLLALPACSPSRGGGGASSEGEGEGEGPTEGEGEGEGPAEGEGEGEGPAEGEGEGPALPDICEALGLPRAALQAGTGELQGDVAADFTVTTLAGSWTLSEEWTGCESYVFLAYFPDLRTRPEGVWLGDNLWSTPLDELLVKSPDNVHFFFVSDEPEAADRRRRMEDMRSRFEETHGAWVATDAERARWRSRFHFVTDRLQELDGGPGAYVGSYLRFLFSPEGLVDLGDRGQAQAPLPFCFGIDRDQRHDPGGSLNPTVSQPPEWGMAAYLGHFFNHKAAIRDRVAGESATVVSLLEETVTERVFVRTVELPDAQAMAELDTLEVDVGVTCNFRNPYACSEWDRIARIDLCLPSEPPPPDPCARRLEIARWITPYWRRGHRRWLIDASPFLGLLSSGGPQTFFVEMGPPWERNTERDVAISLRLSRRGGPRSRGVLKAYDGGGFDADYNGNHGPVSFSVPEEATRVEVVTILSGHGQTDRDNCAEWCDHRHEFSVNGEELPRIRSRLAIGALRGCAERADRGVPPGQGGNWAPARAYWCPGMPVDAIRQNATELVDRGVDNELTYRATFAGREPRGGSIALSTYVVWYGD